MRRCNNFVTIFAHVHAKDPFFSFEDFSFGFAKPREAVSLAEDIPILWTWYNGTYIKTSK